MILLGAIFVLPWIGRQLGMDLRIFQWLVWTPAQFIMRAISQVMGLG